MPIAFVNRAGARVRLDGDSLIVERDEQRVASWELVHLEALIVVGRIVVSARALEALGSRGIPVAFVSTHGGIAARLVGAMHGAVDVRLGQHAVHADPQRRLRAARRVVMAKIRAMRGLHEQWARNSAEYRDPEARTRLDASLVAAEKCDALPSLLGIEGAATACHWAVYRYLLRTRLRFLTRSTRPPRDEINALLSFGYTILAREAWSALEAIGADPFIGFYHECAANRPALALDLMEPFRHACIDVAVLRSANMARFAPDDFASSADDGFRLSDDARAKYLQIVEERLQAPAPEWILADAEDAGRSIREVLHRRCTLLRDWFRGQVAPAPEGEPPDVIAPFDQTSDSEAAA